MIERATPQDAMKLSALVNSAYRGDSSRLGWTTEADLLDGTRTDTDLVLNLLEDPGITILKYVEGSKILGCVELILKENRIHLGMLTVEPGLQGKGIGRQLLVAAESNARTQGCVGIFMHVISIRIELMAWYFRYGYLDTGIRIPVELPDIRWGIPRQPLDFAVLEKVF